MTPLRRYDNSNLDETYQSHLELSTSSRTAVTIDFLLDCSLWYTSCSKMKGIVIQKPDRATLKLRVTSVAFLVGHY